jgi:bifunctional DNA-binding transcriptional regulator/antitoxin component of YhaV-PrlF toxin-antitoxin module
MRSTRISSTYEVTIPADVIEAAGLRRGDVADVDVTGQGTVVLRRAVNPFLAAAGTLQTGS